MNRTDTRTLRAEPHAEIGGILERDASLLVERWCSRALQEQPDAKRVHSDTLRDELPGFVRAMGRALTQSGNPDPSQHTRPAFEHGDQRWDQGWSLPAVVRDWQLLKVVIFEHLEQTLARALEYREVMAVGVFVDDAVAASIVSYVASRDDHHRRAEEQRTQELLAASRHKDEFLALLAHELRNPLAPIANGIRVLHLLLGAPSGQVRETIGVIERQTKQLARLVDDLLDLARISQGRLELRRAPVDLGSVVEQAIQTAEPVLKSRDQRLSVELPQEPVRLEADAARLVQAIVNLLDNAAKYTPRGGSISVSLRREADVAAVRIKDDGVGIPGDMLARVFEMFVQVGQGAPASARGLGVGLALVKRVVELHGGSVTASSEGAGRGSEFTLRLPIAAAARPLAVAAQPTAQEAAKPCRLLVIEDHADARDSLAMLLRLLGHEVDVAASGKQGLERARSSPPQVALIDIGLPDVDGYEVARELRGARGDQIFLIALTGYGQSDDVREAQEAGFDAHLLKPADIDELGRLLLRAATARSAPGAK
jgi:signal transduction histidine kinase/ActR/RegA family two-component response regulator